MGKFVMKKTNTGVKFDLKAGNGPARLSLPLRFTTATQPARTVLSP